MLVGAFEAPKGGYTSGNITQLWHEPFRSAYWLSIQISLVTAIAGGLLGLLIAYAAIRDGTPRWIRTGLTTFSGVAANFAGIPLAFAFIATLGLTGIVTKWMNDYLDWNPWAHGFTLYSKIGVEIVYLYFQIPLMILVIAPAIDGLRREWREASSNLGATPWQFWRYVGIPVLMPSLLGAIILLFGNAFSAYATAYGLVGGGGVTLVTLFIGAYFSGNVLDNPHLAQALAFGMFVVLAVMMVLYIPLQRRAARWVR